MTTRQRLLRLEGCINFRDIGGYQTGDGRQVRWNTIYRTGVLSYITEGDAPTLRKLAVRAICDLRRDAERTHEPSRWPGEAIQIIASGAADHDAAAPAVRQLWATHPATPAGMHDTMKHFYRILPNWLGPRLHAMFVHIANQQVPLLVHCAAGKDRTGIAIAVLLTALGVPAQTIMEDYLLTNTSADFEQFITTRRSAHLGLANDAHPLSAMPQPVRQVMFSVHREFLNSALTQIHEQHGDVAGYLAHHGVTAALLERAKSTLLEPA